MVTTILKARSFATASISPDGLLLAATDLHNYLYIVDLETGELLLERELKRNLESLRFDRAGKRLFLNDRIGVKILEIPSFTQSSLTAAGEFEDATGLTFLDSKVSGETLFFLPSNSNIYACDSSGERCLPVAFVSCDAIDGQYLGTASNKLILSALERVPQIAVANLEVDGLLQKIVPVSEWEEAELLGAASDGRIALFQHNDFTIRDLNSAEVSRWKLPVPTPVHLCAISQSLDTLCVIDRESNRCNLFDTATGQQTGYVTAGDSGATSIVFVEQKGNKKLACSMSDGTILIVPIT
jgi:WD40 repeat protein